MKRDYGYEWNHLIDEMAELARLRMGDYPVVEVDEKTLPQHKNNRKI